MLDHKTRKRWPTTFLNGFAVWIRGATLPASGTRAQEAGVGAPVDPRTLAEPVKRLEDVEPKVRELEKKLDARTFNAASPLPIPGPSAATTTAPVESSNALNTLTLTDDSHNKASAKEVELRIFRDGGYEVSDQKSEPNSFHIGSLDLFLTGKFSDQVSVLGEILFIPHRDNAVEPDVERLLLQFRFNHYFKFAVGRCHSPIRYYNTAPSGCVVSDRYRSSTSYTHLMTTKACRYKRSESREARKIFRGDRSSWPGGKHIVVLMLTSGQSERSVILRDIYQMGETAYAKYYLQATFAGKIQEPPKNVSSALLMKEYLSAYRLAIGYLKKATLMAPSAIREHYRNE